MSTIKYLDSAGLNYFWTKVKQAYEAGDTALSNRIGALETYTSGLSEFFGADASETDTVINRWSEVKSFLSGIGDNTTLNSLLNAATAIAGDGISISTIASGTDRGRQQISVKSGSDAIYVNSSGVGIQFFGHGNGTDWKNLSGLKINSSTSESQTVGLLVNYGDGLTIGDDDRLKIQQANNSTIGGVKLGYTQSGKNYPVVLNAQGQAYVNVPWVDTDNDTKYSASNGLVLNGTQFGLNVASGSSLRYASEAGGYSVQLIDGGGTSYPYVYVNTMQAATASAAGDKGLVPAPAAGDQNKVLSGAGTWVNNPAGTVTSVTLTQGNGITVSSSGTAITSSGTRTISALADTGRGIDITTSGIGINVDGESALDFLANGALSLRTGNGIVVDSSGNLSLDYTFATMTYGSSTADIDKIIAGTYSAS